MIPSMDMYGGWGGLLGTRPREAAPPEYQLSALTKGYLRWPDTCLVDYAAMVRDPVGGLPEKPLLEVANPLDPPKIQDTVALIGGGIANIIAAYELSRCGVKVTLFEAQSTLGGRLRTTPGDLPSELGAMRFPEASRLFWHYVRIWVEHAGYNAYDIMVKQFPNPGVVPTKVCYQGTWFDLLPDPSTLPPVMREAQQRFVAFFTGLNDGSDEPGTIYYGDVANFVRTAPGSHDDQLTRFWNAMRARFDGRSFGDVLQTEVFSSGSNPVDLLAAFGTLGLGTGGFGPLYEVAFLEILRLLIWDYKSEYSLPSKASYSKLDSGATGFANGLAHAALAESKHFFPDRTFDDMFRTGTSVGYLQSDDNGIRVAIGDDLHEFTYAIVAMSNRAMQQLGLDRDTDLGPFSLRRTYSDPQALAAVESVQAGIRQVNMLSAYKMFAQIDVPQSVPNWPKDRGSQLITCFLTDRYPRATYVLPPPSADSKQTKALVSYAWGPDAIKLTSLTPADRQRFFGRAFSFSVVTGGEFRPVRDAIWTAKVVDEVVWNAAEGIGGGFKLDRPDDNYFTSSLFFHPQLAHSGPVKPHTRVFLAGDSVGFAGGWVEGSAMSSLNAITAVLTQISKSLVGATVRSASLIDPAKNPFHKWRRIDGEAAAAPQLAATTRVADCVGNWLRPSQWRPEPMPTDTVLVRDIAVSGDGRHVLAAARDAGGLYYRRFSDSSGWSEFQLVPPSPPDPPLIGRIAISNALRTPGQQEGAVQVLATGGDGVLYHRLRSGGDNGVWGPWGTPPGGGARTMARSCAIACEGTINDAAQVLVTSPEGHDAYLWHGIRFANGDWSAFQPVPGRGATWVDAIDVAAAVAATEDLTTVAVVDPKGGVSVTRRDAVGNWESWTYLPRPWDPAGERAQRICVVANDKPGWEQFVVLTDKGNAWHITGRVTPTGSRSWTAWRPMPYPFSTGQIVSAGIGLATPHACDPAWSTTVYAALK